MKVRRSLFFPITILIISTLLLFDLFNQGIYRSHDAELHVARLAQVTSAIDEGQLPVRWLGNWNFGFGYPTLVFIYSLPYYLGAILRIFVADFEIIFKVLMFVSLSLSGVTFYYFARSLVAALPAFVGAVFYMAAPYRFADIYERGALGESLVFVFIPLIFWAPFVISNNKFRGFVFTSVAIFLLVTTHALTLAIFFIPGLIYSLLVFKDKIGHYLHFLLAIVFGFLLSSFSWMPMIFEQKYIELEKTYFNLFVGHFITINQLLRIPKEGVSIGSGIQLGTGQMIVLVITLMLISYQIIKWRIEYKVVFFFLLTIMAGLLSTNLAEGVWRIVKPLQTLLFPWRFLTFTTFATAVLAGFLADHLIKSKLLAVIVFFLIFVAIYPSRHYLRGHEWHSFDDDYYYEYQDLLALDNYYLPKGLNKDFPKLQLAQASIVEGEGRVRLLAHQSDHIEAEVDLASDSKIQLHTIYFPGWTIYIDGKKESIIANDFNLEGIIVAEVKRGSHRIDLIFEQTNLRKVANLLSLASFFALLLMSAKRVVYLGSARKVTAMPR